MGTDDKVKELSDRMTVAISKLKDNDGEDAIIPGITDMIMFMGFINSSVADSLFSAVSDGRLDKWIELNRSILMKALACKTETDLELNIALFKGVVSATEIVRNTLVDNVKKKLNA